MQSYQQARRDKPLTEVELEEKYKEVQEEMQEVLDWKKEEEDKLKEDKFKTPQAKTACKKNLKKIEKRIDSVNGMLMYWDLRIKGKSHFYASIELNEYWAMLKEKAEDEIKKEAEEKLPELLKRKK
jgi:hypothetical protein